MDSTVLITFLAPILIAFIGILGPAVKTWMERRKPNVEAMAIYDSIEAANAKRAMEQIAELQAEIKRLRKLLRHYRHNPDEIITEPLYQKGDEKK